MDMLHKGMEVRGFQRAPMFQVPLIRFTGDDVW
jgi:hypothetical protein